jgi:hypothetical protein
MNTMHPNTDPEHRAVWDLIPWLVAGSASPIEQQRVQQHLAHCEDCRDELAFHQSLRDGMQPQVQLATSTANTTANITTEATAPDAAADAAANAGLARLWARVDQAQPAAAPGRALGDAPPTVVSSNTPRQRWLVAAVFLQSIGLAALAALLLQRQPEAPYQTLSSPPTAACAALVRLVPAPDVTLGQLSALLARHGLQIVESSHDGTVLGLARLGPPTAVSVPTTLAVPELATRLRSEPGVLLAEPVTSNVGR